MKKELFILATLIISICALTACGKSKEEAPVSPQEAVEEVEAAQEAAEETVKEASDAAKPENALEDFTGDMDLSGSWDDEVSQRASMDVVKNEYGSYNINVHWGGRATETAIWTIHGESDPTSAMLSSDEGKHSNHTFEGQGHERT